MEDKKKVLLSLKDLEVKFHVRGRILTAIRGVSLDIYENESLAIVGESGSGKSVLTKTFSGMLDSNGFISKGELQLYDDELQDTVVKKTKISKIIIDNVQKSFNKYSKLEFGSDIYKEMIALKAERQKKISLTDEEKAEIDDKLANLKYEKTELFNLKQTYDPKNEKDKIAEAKKQLAVYTKQIKELQNKESEIIKAHKAALKADTKYNEEYNSKMSSLKEEYNKAIEKEISNETISRNFKLAKELYLSIGRYGLWSKIKFTFKL